MIKRNAGEQKKEKGNVVEEDLQLSSRRIRKPSKHIYGDTVSGLPLAEWLSGTYSEL
jgi:hypothetical protein